MGVVRYIFVIAIATIMPSIACADGVLAELQQQTPPRFTQTGRATFYHKSLRGMRTAAGERYDPDAMTAAHRRLQLGTYVRVTRLGSNRNVIVKVNDRMPPRSRAIIDLSTAAARKLGMLRLGVAKVRIEALSTAEVEKFLGSQ